MIQPDTLHINVGIFNIYFISDEKTRRIKKYRKSDNENNGADDNLQEENPIYLDCPNGQDSNVQLLLDNSTAVNLCKSQGSRPSSVASDDGHEKTVQLVNGANINLLEKKQPSPLYLACQKGYDSVVKVLIEKGADVNFCDSLGYSLLGVASYYGHKSIVEHLIENGAKVNLSEKNVSSPLYLACQNGHDNIVELLVKKGADVNLRGSQGYSPLAVASHNGHGSIVQHLIKNGAHVN